MVEQIRNDSSVELSRADFFARNEPNAAWSHTVSDHLLLPALRGFWPMSAHHVTVQSGAFVDDIACDYDLSMKFTPTLQVMPYGLPPACLFTGANYLTYPINDIQHQILGTETNILAAQNGLTLGCWVMFTALGVLAGIMSKWEATIGNERSYCLFKSAADQIVFAVSGNGAASVTVTSPAVIAANTWYHVIGRFAPSTTWNVLDVYVDAVGTPSAVGLASLFNSSEPFQIGCEDRANFLSGYVSLAWLCASCCWDGNAGTRNVIPFALYEHSKRLFNK
jgi:hypothetical protein